MSDPNDPLPAPGSDARVGLYGPYEPQDSGYFHWTAQWPTQDWHCGYPLLPGTEWIELTDGRYGQFNGHDTMVRFDGHLIIGHNNHAGSAENSSGQRCLAWIHRLGDAWDRGRFNPRQNGEPIDIFGSPAPMAARKFEETARFLGAPRFQQLPDGTIMAIAGVHVIRRGTKLQPHGKVNTWVTICTLARSIDLRGELGPVRVVAVADEALFAQAQQAGYLQHTDARGEDWVPELLQRDIVLPPGRGNVATDGRRATEFRDLLWLDDERRLAVCMGRGENTDAAFRGYTARSDDGGRTWQTPEPTNIPSGENTITLARLPDGRPLILGTLGDRHRGERRPLSLAIADDGRHFGTVFRLSETDAKHQMASVVIHDDNVYISGPHRSNGNNGGRGEHFALRLPLAALA